ncbi:MAG: hypothetical protein FWF43_00560 [Propionibacteriaceae bacterium]|nr:hypothetical protein [Propionibacteriaceae bacterium]
MQMSPDADPTSAGTDANPESQPVTTYPLFPVDPPQIGDFWPTARLVATPSGVAYLAHTQSSTDPVMVILLSQGAAEDPAARDRLGGQVDRMDIDTVIARGGLDQNTGRMADKFSSGGDSPQAANAVIQSPWVALAYDQTPRAVQEAARILAEVDLSWLPQQGNPAGPDYRLHWTDRIAPGLTKVWPLPWPGRRDRGGRLSIFAAWLLMLLLGAIAILIVLLIFSQAPQTQPPPPVPQTNPTEQTSPPPTSSTPPTESPSPSPESPSPSNASPSPSPSSESPSPTNGSESPSPSPTPGTASPMTASPSPGQQTTAPVGGSPTPPSRL